MQIKYIKLQNIGPFEFFERDFSNLPGGLIAISGENGKGKTFLISSLSYTPLFREWPDDPKTQTSSSTRGVGFVEHCNGKLGTLENHFVYNQNNYKILLTGEPKSRKQSAFIWKNGVNLNESGRLPEFDAIIKAEFPPREVFLSGPVTLAAGDGSFFKLDKKKRQDLLFKLLNITHFDNEIRYLRDEAKVLQEELSSLEEKRNQADHLANRVEMARIDTLALTAQIEELEKSYQWLRRQQEGLVDQIAKCKASNEKRQFFVEERAKRWAKVADLVDLDVAALEARRQALKAMVTPMVTEKDRLSRGAMEATAELNRFSQAYPYAHNHHINPHWPPPGISTYEEESAQIREDSADSLGQIDLGISMCRKCPLTRGAQDAKLTARQMRAEMARAESHLGLIAEWVKEGEDFRSWVFSLLFKKQIEQEDRAYDIQKDLDPLLEELFSIEEKLKNYPSLDLDLAYLEELEIQISAHPHYPLDGLTQAHKSHQASLAEKEVDRETTRKALATLNSNLVGSLAVAGYDTEIDRNSTPDLDLGRISQRVQSNFEVFSSEIKNKTELYSDHIDLIDSIKALRRLIVRTACPDISGMTNSLLTNYQDGRFQLRFDVELDDEKEDFVFYIVDTKTGRTGTHVSSGERSVIDECFRTAISIFNSKQSGYPFLTIFRDEATKHLSEHNALTYINMSRAALEIGGLTHIFFISHHESVVSQADMSINL